MRPPVTASFSLTIEAPDGAFELGQSARVYLPRHGNGALSVPLSALQRSGQGAAVLVVDAKTSTLTLRPVQLGPYGDDRAPVRGGLVAGALFVLPSLLLLILLSWLYVIYYALRYHFKVLVLG